MSKFTEETSAKLKRMRQQYFLPIDLEGFLADLHEVRLTLPSYLSSIADALEHNMKSITETMSLPFELASAYAHSRHWQRLSTAERIRSETLDCEPDETPEAYETRKAKTAIENAHRSMQEFLSSDEGVDRVSYDIADFLLSAHDRGTISKASSELILQGAALTWSSFEVFVRDVFVEVINNDPRLVELLLQDQSTKRRFDIAKVSIDILSEYNFDVSSKMGSILASQQDLSDLRTIKSVFQCLYGGDQDLCNCINSDALWRLSQQRHLIVHRRGIVDSEYIKNTGASLLPGSKIEITPKDLEQYIHAVTDAACRILRVVAAPRLAEG